MTICSTSISGDVSGAYSQRKEIAAEYAEMWEKIRSVQFEDVVSYMNKRQFVQYFKRGIRRRSLRSCGPRLCKTKAS